jgi:hypothetical protein
MKPLSRLVAWDSTVLASSRSADHSDRCGLVAVRERVARW